MSFELPYTWKDYFVLVKEPELVSKALEYGWNNFVFFEKEDFSDDEVGEIIRVHKNIIKFHLDPNNRFRFETRERIRDLDIYITSFNPYGLDKNADDEKIETFTDVLEYLPRIINRMELRMLREGLRWCNDYEDQCGNCHNYLDKEDKYCRNCGTERGKGKFIPYKIGPSAVLYGAPSIRRKYKCLSCGNKWETVNSVSGYCPKCGSARVKLFEEIEKEDWFID